MYVLTAIYHQRHLNLNHLIIKFILKKDSNEEEDDGEKVLFKLDYFEKKSFKQIHLDRPKIEYLQQRVP